MKVSAIRQTREEYLATQIARSRQKFGFCKVSAHDVARYRAILRRALAANGGAHACGPVVCLGSRSGREVDLFRIHLFGPAWRRAVSRASEVERHSYVSVLPWLERRGRATVVALSARCVVGVDVNPDARRADVHVGSFDDLPPAWSGRFGVVFSNSFDQSQDPHRTAAEWKRVLRPGGHLIFCFARGLEPSLSDPVGGLELADVCHLFGGTLVHFAERGSRAGYSEAVLRIDAGEVATREVAAREGDAGGTRHG
jgi:hypothetical protein